MRAYSSTYRLLHAKPQHFEQEGWLSISWEGKNLPHLRYGFKISTEGLDIVLTAAANTDTEKNERGEHYPSPWNTAQLWGPVCKPTYLSPQFLPLSMMNFLDTFSSASMINRFKSNNTKFHNSLYEQKWGHWDIQICGCTRQGLDVMPCGLRWNPT